MYIDYCKIVYKDFQTIEDLVISLKTGPENFFLTDEGVMENYLGEDIRPLKGDTFGLCQPYLIKKVVDLLNLPHSLKGHSTPANNNSLSQDDNEPPRKNSWHYLSSVGMLSYLQGLTRPDISMAVHQCVRLSNDPGLIHKRDKRKIGNYLS